MFDPPHIGHVIVAREAAWQLGLDEVRLVVCARPPHREPGVLDPEDRFRLVCAAVAGHSGLVASRAELDRPGPSYTVETLEAMAAGGGGLALTLIVGADQLRSFHSWREPDRILELARLGVVARDQSDQDAVAELAEHVAPGRVDVVAMPQVGVSSTLIRERIGTGAPVDHLLPPGVTAIVDAEGLYRPQSALP